MEGKHERRDNSEIIKAIEGLKEGLLDGLAENLGQRIARLEAQREAQAGRCEAHAKKLEKHESAIYGNGSLGINTKMILVICAVFLLALIVGADSPLVKKALELFS